MKVTKVVSVAALLISSSAFSQADFASRLLDVQHNWAKINYELQGDKQQEEFKKLSELADELTEAYPNKAEAWVWTGIVQSSYAGVKGGLGALSLAKAAKGAFEHGLVIDEAALNGSAYTSLGVLYHKVPGWPIGFGDDEEAERLLEKALAIQSTGIDSNYFYAEYLFDEGKYQQAAKYLAKAKLAKPRLDRPLADKYRMEEVHALQARVDKKLKN